tara:strand:- start:143 stop:460 length:318 start_codon:yes stop_codon:yes gene_type:complete
MRDKACSMSCKPRADCDGGRTPAFRRRQIAPARASLADPERNAGALISMNEAAGGDKQSRADPDDPIDTARVMADIRKPRSSIAGPKRHARRWTHRPQLFTRPIL